MQCFVQLDQIELRGVRRRVAQELQHGRIGPMPHHGGSTPETALATNVQSGSMP